MTYPYVLGHKQAPEKHLGNREIKNQETNAYALVMSCLLQNHLLNCARGSPNTAVRVRGNIML